MLGILAQKERPDEHNYRKIIDLRKEKMLKAVVGRPAPSAP
jgi:hypothetical protein